MAKYFIAEICSFIGVGDLLGVRLPYSLNCCSNYNQKFTKPKKPKRFFLTLSDPLDAIASNPLSTGRCHWMLYSSQDHYALLCGFIQFFFQNFKLSAQTQKEKDKAKEKKAKKLGIKEKNKAPKEM